MKKKTPRRPLRLAVLLAVQLLVTALVLEAGLRIYAGWSGRVRGAGYHEVYGWKLMPNVRKQGGHWGDTAPASTNSHGWRDVERNYEKSDGTYRVVALGDSFTFGWGVDDGNRFTEVMERLSPGLEVLNMGVHGYGTDQEFLVFGREGRLYRPDLVLLTICLENDLDDLKYERHYAWPKPYFRPEGDSFAFVPPVETMDVSLRMMSYLVEAGFQIREGGRPGSTEAAVWSGEDTTPLFAWLMQRIAEQVRAEGARLLVMLVYPAYELETARSEQSEAVRSILSDLEFDVVDTFDAFQEALRRGDDLILPADIHWNAAGHRLAAKLIVSAIPR